MDDISIEVEIEDESTVELTGFIGPYHLLRRIGGGAMGDVYLARPVHPSRAGDLVAIKVFTKRAIADTVQQKLCLQEAYLLSLLNDDNVIRTFESGMHEGRLFICMAYVDGVNLETLLGWLAHSKLTLPLPLVAEICHALLTALEHVHSARDSDGKALAIVHRDICPSNVFLSRDGRVHLGDFSISVRDGAADKLIAGHLGYMPPEQFEAVGADQRSDLFGLAAAIFHMCTGRAPFDRDDAKKSYLAAVKGNWGATPKAISGFVGKALAPKAKARFQSAAEMRAAVVEIFGPAPHVRGVLAALVRRAAQPMEEGEQVRDKARMHDVLVLAPRPEAAIKALGEAGYHAVPIADLAALTPRTGVPVTVDLADMTSAQVEDINRVGLPCVIALGGALTQPSLERAARLKCQWLDFEPYQKALLVAGIVSESRVLSLRPAPSQSKAIASRRVLLVGFGDAQVSEVAAHFKQLGVRVEARADASEARALAHERSFHLVVTEVARPDESLLRDITAFRRQFGYELAPALIRVPDRDSAETLATLSPPAVSYVHEATALALCTKIKEVLATACDRAFVRYPVKLRVDYTYRGVAAAGTLTNVGRLGVLLHCAQIVHAGDRLALRCPAFTEEAPVQVAGTVAHIRLGEQNDAGAFIGLDFADMSDREEAAWLRYLSDVVEPVC